MCLFCEIVKGNIPSYKVYEDSICVAFLDISQANFGHTLVVPKEHFENILDVSDECLKHCFCVAKRIANNLKEKLDVEDFNIINNCGEVAGQTIHHFHIHIIPRTIGDNIKLEFASNKLTEEEFKDLLNKIKM